MKILVWTFFSNCDENLDNSELFHTMGWTTLDPCDKEIEDFNPSMPKRPKLG